MFHVKQLFLRFIENYLKIFCYIKKISYICNVIKNTIDMKTIELSNEEIKVLRKLVMIEYENANETFEKLFEKEEYERSEKYSAKADTLGEIYLKLRG